MVNVLLSGAATEAMLSTFEPNAVCRSAFFMMDSYVHSASAEVMGSPSDHVAFGCMVYVQVSLSSDTFHDLASPGASALSLAAFSTRLS